MLKNGVRENSPVKTIMAVAPEPTIFDLRGTLSEEGYVLPPGLSYDEWEADGKNLGRIGNSWRFWVGDWWAYGEHHFGEEHSQAINELKLSFGEIAKFASISRAIPPEIRRKDLTWSHHEAVAPLDSVEDRKALLDVAASTGLSRAELRLAVKAVKTNDGHFPPAEGWQAIVTSVELVPVSSNFEAGTALAVTTDEPVSCKCHCHHDVCAECLKPVGPLA